MLASDWQNPGQRLDVNNDLSVTALDALMIINRLPIYPDGQLPDRATSVDRRFLDPTGESKITALDALQIINALGRSTPLVSLRLLTDTAPGSATNDDLLTSIVTIEGAVQSASPIDRLLASWDDSASPPAFDLTFLLDDGRFVIDEIQLSQLASGSIGDGAHTLRIVAVDDRGSVSETLEYTFRIDRSSPDVDVLLDAVVPFSIDAISISFDEPVAPSALLASSYDLRTVSGSPIVIDSVSRDSAVMVTLQMTSLDVGDYELTVTDSILDLAGNRLAGDVVHAFSIVGSSSSVTQVAATSPADGEQFVSVVRSIIVDFSSRIDAASVDNSDLLVEAAGRAIAGELDVSSTGRFMTFTPLEPFPSSSKISVTLQGDEIVDPQSVPVDADNDGVAGGARFWTFQTLPLTRVTGTEVTGFVYDSYHKLPDGSDRPIVGATIRVDAFPEANAVTDENGFFRLVDMPAPEFFVHIDGSTATNAPAGTGYPSVGKPFHSIPGLSTPLKMDGVVFNIYLPPMSMGDVVALSATDDTVVGFGAGGVALLQQLFPTTDPGVWNSMAVTYPAGSARDASGDPVTKAVVIPVPPNRLPAPLPSAMTTSLVVSVQAPGATAFDVPAAVTMPNVDNLPAGSKAQLVSFNHSAGRWEAQGTATVSSDGTTVSTDPGVGIRAPGWHLLNPAVRVTGRILLPAPGRTMGAIFGEYDLPLELSEIPFSKAIDPASILYLAFENQTTGFVSRTRATSTGAFEFLLGAQTQYKLFAYDHRADLAGLFEFATGAPGSILPLATMRLGEASLADADDEGLTDVSERAVGTFVGIADTDADNLSDFAEFRLGTDPLGGNGLLTGKIAEAPIAGDYIRDLLVAPSRRFIAGEAGLLSTGKVNQLPEVSPVYAYVVSEKVEFDPETFEISTAPFLQVVNVSEPLNPTVVSTITFDPETERLLSHGDPLAYDPTTDILSLSILEADERGVFQPKVRLYQAGQDRLVPRFDSLSTEARITLLNDGLAYVVVPDPTRTYSDSAGYCVLCIPNDVVQVYDYASGELLDVHQYTNRVVHDIALSDGKLYSVANSVAWRRSGSNYQPVESLHLDRLELERNGLLQDVVTTASLPKSELGSPNNRLVIDGNLVAVTGVLPAGGSGVFGPGIVLVRDQGMFFETVGEPTPIGALRLSLDGNGLGAYSSFFGGFVNLLDLSDPAITDQILTSFEVNSGNALFVFSPPALGLFDGKLFIPDGNTLSVVNYLPADGDGTPPSVRLTADALDVDLTREGIQVVENSHFTLDADALSGRVQSFELFADSRSVALGIAPNYAFPLIAPDLDGGSRVIRFVAAATEVTGRVVETNEISIEVVEDTFAPRVIEVSPEVESDVPDNTARAVISFDEPLAPGAIASANFRVIDSSTQMQVPLTRISGMNGDVKVLLEFEPLAEGNYELQFDTSAIVDAVGNAQTDGVFTSPFSVGGRLISWIGQDGEWADPSNWDLGRVPGRDDEVVIGPGVGVVNLSNLSFTLRRLQSSRPLSIVNSTLVVREALEFSETLSVSNSTILGGVLRGQGSSAKIQVDPVGGIVLDGVTLDGQFDVALSGGSLAFVGETLVTGEVALQVNGASIAIAGRSGALATLGGSGTLRIQSSGNSETQVDVIVERLHLEADFTLEIDGGVQVNHAAPAGQPPRSLVNDASIIIADGRRMRLNADEFLGDGTLTLGNGSVMQFLGPLNSESLRQLRNNGGTVEISDDLLNEGRTLRLSTEMGQLRFAGGRLIGGMYDQGDAASTSFTSTAFQSRFVDVTLVGDHLFSGGIVHLEGQWVNAGSITLDNNVLALGGDFDQFGSIDSGTGWIELTGRYDNTAKVLDLTTDLGPWYLVGGQIVGGTIRTGVTPRLLIEFLNVVVDNRLSGVSIDGNLDVRDHLSIDGGLSVSGDLDATGVTITFDGDGQSQTLHVNGSVQLPKVVRIGNNHTLSFSSDQVVTISDDVAFVRVADASGTRLISNATVQVSDTFHVDLDEFENRGNLEVDASRGDLELEGRWHNSGLIQLKTGSVALGGMFEMTDLGDFQRTGGTLLLTGILDNRGRTFATNAAIGSIIAEKGTILGGVLEAPKDGTSLSDTGLGLKLDGTTLAAGYDYVVTVAIGLANEYVILGSVDASSDFARVELSGESRLSQYRNVTRSVGKADLYLRGTLDLEGAELNPLGNLGGSLITFDGTIKNGSIGPNTTDLFTQGSFFGVDSVEIDADFSLRSNLFVQGPLTVNAVLAMVGSGPGTTVEMLIGAGVQSIGGPGTIRFSSINPIPRIRGTEEDSELIIEANLTIDASQSSLAIGQFGPLRLENRGTIRIGGAGRLDPSEFINRGVVIGEPSADITMSGLMVNAGTITARIGSYMYLSNESARIDLDPLGTLIVEVAGAAFNQHGRIQVGSSSVPSTLAGALQIAFVDGYDPPVGTRIEIGLHGGIQGQFDSMTALGLGVGKGIALLTDANLIVIEIILDP